MLSSFRENAVSVNEAGDFLSQIAASIREESLALNDGLVSLSSISSSVKDTHAVFTALGKAHSYLDSILDREQ